MVLHGDHMTTTAQLGGAAESIGEYVRERRLALDLTKAEAARRAGVSRRTWHEVEEGTRPTSSAETLSLFEQVLDIPPGTLFAMTPKSEHARVEALRARAVALVRLMSTDELELFVESHGVDTLQSMLRQLAVDVAALRDGAGPQPRTRARRAS